MSPALFFAEVDAQVVGGSHLDLHPLTPQPVKLIRRALQVQLLLGLRLGGHFPGLEDVDVTLLLPPLQLYFLAEDAFKLVFPLPHVFFLNCLSLLVETGDSLQSC